jgi:hypothetical protein
VCCWRGFKWTKPAVMVFGVVVWQMALDMATDRI